MSSHPRGPWIGALFRAAWQRVRDEIAVSVEQAGFGNVTRAQLLLFRYPGLDGIRPSQLAEEMQISKQGINGLLNDLESRGYIRRDVHPADKRSRVVRLTPKGVELENTVLRAARDAERQLERQLGPAQFRSLRTAMIEASGVLADPPSPEDSADR